MASVNKVILVGNLGKDPDVRYLPDGGAVVNLALATSNSWKDKNTGEKREETPFQGNAENRDGKSGEQQEAQR